MILMVLYIRKRFCMMQVLPALQLLVRIILYALCGKLGGFLPAVTVILILFAGLTSNGRKTWIKELLLEPEKRQKQENA